MLLSGLVEPGAVLSLRSSSTVFEFNAAHRLLQADGFDHVVGAQNISSSQHRVFYVPNRKGNARLGVIASKKTLPSAVQRNRAKRIIREVFRQHTIKAHQMDLVVMLRRAGSQASLKADLEALFSRLENRCASK